MKSFQFTVQGLTCEACAKIIKKRLGKVTGVGEITVDLNGHVEIQASRDIDIAEFAAALQDTNYTLKY